MPIKRNKPNFWSNWNLKKKLVNGEIEHLLFEDESTIRDYQALQATWFPIGQQKKIKTYGKHYSVKLTGILNYETGAVYVEESDTFDAKVFQGFLENVLKLYPTGIIVMVLDNSRVHHAKILQDFLRRNVRLRLLFLPPYSPNLNAIEELWKWLKETCVNNVFFSKYYQIKIAVRAFVRWVNTIPKETIDRLCL
ncbi:IS630 family transposase [Enterococcus sp. AZ194]|uniref:IS630 family transposase n=1 Tax=Enterococcus sp. AZ194 TaxID=2774629 RepID=UPI003F684BFC